MAKTAASGVQEVQQLLQTHALEVAYEKCRFQAGVLYEEEKGRHLRLRIMLLEDDNDDLHAQLLKEDIRIDELETSTLELQNQIKMVEGEAEHLRGILRIKNREIENIKAEIESLQGVSMDSTKLLTEKLSLSRELAALRPEIEHLRSQATSHQTLLADKLSLQRQLSSAQVELETEKRATQRALTREEGKHEQDAMWEAKIDELQSDLAKERRERQKAERESQKVVAEFEGKKTILESRLDAFRNKLRMTKDQLKETQDELQSIRATARAKPALAASKTAPAEAARNPRKRSLAQVDTDATIGTPGVVPAAKRNKRGSTLPGDKSAFSITPFLNRTASVAPESPPGEKTAVEDQLIAAVDDDVQSNDVEPTVESPSVKITKDDSKNQSKKVTVSKVSSAIASTKAGPGRKKKIVPALEQVQEEENDENLPPATSRLAVTAVPTTKPKIKVMDFNDRFSEEPTILRKKRKLLGGGLGKTLFDDDDGEMNKASDRGLFGAVRGFGTVGKSLGNGRLGPRVGLGASVGGFGAFSPLKKDRKAIGGA